MLGRFILFAALLSILAGCASVPPGADYPKARSAALQDPENTRLGGKFEAAAKAHAGNSGFRIIPDGKDALSLRMQMIDAAEKTLDLQYFIFRGDHTGKLLTDAVLRAAARGVRVRILIDDGETRPDDDQIARLESHPSIEIRIFNPFAYHGHSMLIRAAEFLFNARRLDYRMHNKLLVADNAVALIGGRNIGDQYFQMDPSSQFADDDVFAAGPIVKKLSESFDEFWNCDLSIPIEALALGPDQPQPANDPTYISGIATGEPLSGILSGRLPLTWAHATLVYDSPDKKNVESGKMAGNLMNRSIVDAASEVKDELLIITPYLVPGKEGMDLIGSLRDRKVNIRILTSSLDSSTVLLAQAGYMHYRIPLLEKGVGLYEIRSRPENSRGSGESRALLRYGNYSLHAKLFVFDHKRVFIGSMNFDQRSMHLNTEIGLIIDSPLLAAQISSRFDAMTQPENAYRLLLTPQNRIVWLTQEKGKRIEYLTEPARSDWQRIEADTLSLLPVDDEL